MPVLYTSIRIYVEIRYYQNLFKPIYNKEYIQIIYYE